MIRIVTTDGRQILTGSVTLATSNNIMLLIHDAGVTPAADVQSITVV